MKEKGLIGFLVDHAGKEPVSFHMPGHKGSQFYKRLGYEEMLKSMVDMDITEIHGADNLFQTEGVIKATMEKYRRLYDSKESYLLINGSSAGIIASMMAAVKEGGTIIMARNCHKSAFNALSLGKLQPVYAYPEVLDEYGILGEVKAEEIERCIVENPETSAVILPSPNYYGICSDIEAIAGVAHKYGKVLIVDQAHGAHLKMFDKFAPCGLPKSAEEAGADLVNNSTHKTLGSLTQSAVLNLCSDRVDQRVLEDKLQQIQSTSPSYILMASLDCNADILLEKGEELLRDWSDNLEYFYGEVKKLKGVKVLTAPNLDWTKINLDLSSLGVDGDTLDKLLMEKGVYAELVTGNILMCMTGIGNRRCDFERLLEALKEVSLSGTIGKTKPSQPEAVTAKLELKKIPMEKELVNIDDAQGRICASSIIPYPPGIPIVCPGEVINSEVARYVALLRQRGDKVMGIDSWGRVSVGK